MKYRPIYKCGMCGKLGTIDVVSNDTTEEHITQIMNSMIYFRTAIRINDDSDVITYHRNVHICGDGKVGFANLIGFEPVSEDLEDK